MGVVWKAEDTKLHRLVALKSLPPSVTADAARLERFKREATAIVALNHPNIVTVHSIEEADEEHFLTMELVQRRTLSECIPADARSDIFSLGIVLYEMATGGRPFK